MRTREMIERELRLLARVRNAYRENGYAVPSIGPVDALLDELSELPRVDPYGVRARLDVDHGAHRRIS